MNEIDHENRFKFKAWLIKEKVMAEVTLIDYGAKIVHICYSDMHRVKWKYFNDVILVQCTGLLATSSYRGKNEEDRLIFEGDVLEIEGNFGEMYTDVVSWEYFAFGLTGEFLASITDDVECVPITKIIGNIHEHPHLLTDDYR